MAEEALRPPQTPVRGGHRNVSAADTVFLHPQGAGGLASPLPPSSPLSPLISSPPMAADYSLLLPPLSSDGLIISSPIVGTREQRTAKAREKGRRKLAARILSQREEEERRHLEMLEEKQKADEAAETQKHGFFDKVLSALIDHGYTFGELLLYVSNPVFGQGKTRWDGLFKDQRSVGRVLNFWALKAGAASRQQVHNWAVDYVVTEVKREAQAITASGLLQTLGRPVNAGLVLGFNMSAMQSHLEEHGPVFMRVFKSVATSKRQRQMNAPTRMVKKLKVYRSVIFRLL